MLFAVSVLALWLNSISAVAQFGADRPLPGAGVGDERHDQQLDGQLVPLEIEGLFEGAPAQETQLPRLQPHRILNSEESVLALVFSDDGSMLITGVSGTKLSFWNTAEAKIVKTVELPAGSLCDLGITPNQNLVASTREGGLYVFDLQTYELKSQIETGIAFRAMAVRNQTIFTGSDEGVVHQWELTGKTATSESTSLNDPITAIASPPSGHGIAVGTLSGKLAIWESLDKEPDVKSVGSDPIQTIAFHPDGEDVAIVGLRTEFRDPISMAMRWRMPAGNNCQRTLGVFSLDGGYFLSTCLDLGLQSNEPRRPTSRIEIHDVKNHTVAGRLLGQEGVIEAIEISPDGKFVATATDEGDIAIWRSPFDVVDTFHLRLRRASLTEQIEQGGPRGFAKVRLYQQRAFLNARLKRWKAAANDFQNAQQLAPHDTMHWMRAGVMLLLAEDRDGYREHAKAMLEKFRLPPNAYAAERTAKLLILPEQPIGDEKTASDLAAFGTKYSGRSPWSMYFPTTEALVKYRFGEFDKALELIEISRNRNRPGQNRPDVAQMLNHVVEGLCWGAKGEKQAAREALQKADEYLRPFRIRPTSIDDSSQHDWFIGQMLYDEAEQLIK